jgi:hypothetical protein
MLSVHPPKSFTHAIVLETLGDEVFTATADNVPKLVADWFALQLIVFVTVALTVTVCPAAREGWNTPKNNPVSIPNAKSAKTVPNTVPARRDKWNIILVYFF